MRGAFDTGSVHELTQKHAEDTLAKVDRVKRAAKPGLLEARSTARRTNGSDSRTKSLPL